MPAGGRTVQQGGRAKAYRPLPAQARRSALAAFLAAYDRGDAFLAHELLEPAWMGTAVMPERELYQGLIKLAASDVHAVRGNPVGEVKNLRGARARLAAAASARAQGGPDGGLDLERLLESIDRRLGALASGSAAAVPPDGPAVVLPRRASAG
jgi:predicted metal-dependent hydrolase